MATMATNPGVLAEARDGLAPIMLTPERAAANPAPQSM
jgi:hypothetical protein